MKKLSALTITATPPGYVWIGPTTTTTHMLMFSDMLSDAIARQFAQKFAQQ